jgi:hypothetical protein
VAERSILREEIQTKRQAFEAQFTGALKELERLRVEVGALNEEAEMQSFGLYRPHFDFGTAESYKRRLEEVRANQAEMLKGGTAARCATNWTVDGSTAKGQKMTARQLKLMLRAFNGECDASVGKVRFNNVVALEDRIRKSFEAIDKLGEPNQCAIVPVYLSLKVAELRLAHEYAEKVAGRTRGAAPHPRADA